MEICGPLNLSVDEASLIDMHSVLNVMNVITFELVRMESIFGYSSELENLIEENARAAKILRDPEQAHAMVGQVDDFISNTENSIQALASKENKAGDAQFQEILNNIHSIFNILEVRAAEIAARVDEPCAWVRHDIDKLKKNFTDLFQAIEQNSHKGYGIVHNDGEHRDGCYLIRLEIDSSEGGHLHMPAVFQDIVRDLFANSRKYTAPGGKIIGTLSQDEKQLFLVVSDTGMGIPPEEIEGVVKFGNRGSNVRDRPTRGGGFGLTKAYYVTQKFGGRMWIDSTGVPGEGTRVEIKIPLPSHLAEA